MKLTVEQIKKIDEAINVFFEKVDRRGRIAQRMLRAMDKAAKYLRPKVNEWLENMRRKIIGDLTKKYIEKRAKLGFNTFIRKDRALDIATKLTDWEWIQENGKEILKPAMLKILGDGANEAYLIAGIEGSFDVLNSKSVAWAEKHCAKMVKEITDETRKGIKLIIRDGIKKGKSVRQIAKEIRPLIGLNSRQMMAVVNYEEWLIVNRPELSQREIDRRVDVYARRMHRRRADMIARTESGNALIEGSLQGYEDAGVKKVEVIVTRDEKTCPICMEHDGEVHLISNRDKLPLYHPLCRCCVAAA